MKIEDIKQAIENNDLSPIVNNLTTDMLQNIMIEGEPLINKIVENQNMTIHALHLMNQEMLTIKDNDGKTPVHTAALHGHLDQIKDKITKEMLTTPNKGGWTPLNIADLTGHLDQIEDILIKELLNPERHTITKEMLDPEIHAAKDKEGEIPLQYATKEHIENAEKMNKNINEGNTPVQDATKHVLPYPETLSGFRTTPVYYDPKNGNLDRIKDIPKKINKKDLSNKLDAILKKLDQKTVEKIEQAKKEKELIEKYKRENNKEAQKLKL